MLDEDEIAWLTHPQYRLWFNKLYVAEHFGYKCGPSGVSVPKKDHYIVRPIYNLAGMGVNAKLKTLKPGDHHKVPAGHFWVEYFRGTHYSIDYVKINNQFEQLNCYIGTNTPKDLSLFSSWIRSNHRYTLPESLNQLSVERLNIEVIGDKIIEVHLRNGFDHMMQYEEIIPVFKNERKVKKGYTYVEGPADGYGKLKKPRIGYLVK